MLRTETAGQGNADAARVAGRAGIVVVRCFIVCLMALLFSLRHQTPNLYSEDGQVKALATRVIPIYCLYMFCSASMWALRGNLNGCGKQAIAAKLGLLASYGVGVPLGVALCFFAPGWGSIKDAGTVEPWSLSGPSWGRDGWGIFGLWWGLTAGLLTAVVMCSVVLSRIDWAAQAQVARARALRRTGTGGGGGGGG
jgi:Na+-driven multidrug efflux pump